MFSYRNALRTALTIYQNSGLLGLWRGHGATLMRVIPYSATSFMTYDRYASLVTAIVKGQLYLPRSSRSGAAAEGQGDGEGGAARPQQQHLHHSRHGSSREDVAIRFISGACAGATATAITYPLGTVVWL
jgi:solute carrier family 25 protein 42